MGALSFKSLKTVSKKICKWKMKRSRNVQGFSLEGQMGEANKFSAFNREQGNAAKLGRGGDSLCFLPLFSPKNTIYEFHGNGWWNESITFTRSPFFEYNS